MKWLRELACNVFGHSPIHSSLSVPNRCVTCRRPMAWNPGLECWDILYLQSEDNHEWD